MTTKFYRSQALTLMVMGLALILTACTDTPVRVGLHDRDLPKIGLIAISGMRQTSITASQGENVSLTIDARDEVYFLATGGDTMGIKRVFVAARNAGQLIHLHTFNLASQIETIEDTTSEGMGTTGIAFFGKVILPEGQETTISATAEDWAGNKAFSASLHIRRAARPTATLTAIPNYTTSQARVPVNYKTTNADSLWIGIQSLDLKEGVRDFYPEDINYVRLKARGVDQKVGDSLCVYRLPNAQTPKIGYFYASSHRGQPEYGRENYLYWDCSSNITKIRIEPFGFESTSFRGKAKFQFTGNYRYGEGVYLTAYGPGGTTVRRDLPRMNQYYGCDGYTYYLQPPHLHSLSTANGMQLWLKGAVPRYLEYPDTITYIRNFADVPVTLVMGTDYFTYPPQSEGKQFNGRAIDEGFALLIPANASTDALKKFSISYNRDCYP